MIVSIEVEKSKYQPIQISIVYDDNGDVVSIDWRSWEEMDVLVEKEVAWEDQSEDEDPDYFPGMFSDDYETDDSDDY